MARSLWQAPTCGGLQVDDNITKEVMAQKNSFAPLTRDSKVRESVVDSLKPNQFESNESKSSSVILVEAFSSKWNVEFL